MPHKEPEPICKDEIPLTDDGENSKEHPVFTKDPAEYMQWLYKEICVTTDSGMSHTGRCYTVDPVSQSIVLVKMESNDDNEKEPSKLQLVMGHCIENVTVLDDDVDTYKDVLDNLLKNRNSKDGVMTAKEIKERQKVLLMWLSKNRIPVKVCEDRPDVLSISDALFISPPYEANNCQSTNEIILGKVQGLIKNMPKDQEQW